MPCLVTEGGVNLVTAYPNLDISTIDIDGNSRTVPWSIGPYEYDSCIP